MRCNVFVVAFIDEAVNVNQPDAFPLQPRFERYVYTGNTGGGGTGG